ncbi:SurA N-terminal domain-containing protein [Salipaludibacillus aurantiacus]|uniref:SurA N-terminal domain-containing protein n=1 Tax=Salipaludibacillus aurantiacus TaxID=1601833 RepID=A0A1H9PCZ2_9BACI|nr:SurA N-terminal domain-containing protein [Salipaludibacillus aurantiacus]SER45775.1 SurA N-terminal domain-containing protein [Salipaludibacillus aurantiacus]
MKRFSKKSLLALPLSAALVLAACGDGNEENGNNENGGANEADPAENNNEETADGGLLDGNENNEEAMDEEADMDADPEATAAVVNGEEIQMGDLQEQMAQYEQMFAQQGIDFEDEENAELLVQIQQGILDELINQTVLLQEAEEQGIEVSDEEVEAELEQIKGQFEDEDQYEEALASQNYTEEELTDEIRESLRVQELLTLSHLEDDELEVSQEEVQAYYDQMAMQNPEIGDFEDLESELEEEVKQQQYVAQLRDDADIEIAL